MNVKKKNARNNKNTQVFFNLARNKVLTAVLYYFAIVSFKGNSSAPASKPLIATRPVQAPGPAVAPVPGETIFLIVLADHSFI